MSGLELSRRSRSRTPSVPRVVGRTFPGEESARFAFGVRWHDEVVGIVHQGERAAVDAEPQPPPTDLGFDRWLTVTPDPGVIEVNMAPAATTRSFYSHAQQVWRAAES